MKITESRANDILHSHQPPSGVEVVGEVFGPKETSTMVALNRALPPGTKLYTAPPRAPVGVDGLVRDLVREIERNTCTHEETHRGGFLWEICDLCGAKWADDRGGKPEFQWPDCVERAHEWLAQQPAAVDVAMVRDAERSIPANLTTAKDAEIARERWLRERAEDRCVAVEDQREALRAEVEEWKRVASAQAKLHGEAETRAERLEEALRVAEAALADIGDADREPGDDVAWCERRASEPLPMIRALLQEQEEGK